jgi:hypothetical protein
MLITVKCLLRVRCVAFSKYEVRFPKQYDGILRRIYSTHRTNGVLFLFDECKIYFPIATRILSFENNFWINMPDSVVAVDVKHEQITQAIFSHCCSTDNRLWTLGLRHTGTVTTIEADEGVASSDFLGEKQRERERERILTETTVCM